MLVSSKVAKIIKPSALLVWLMLYFLVVPSCLFGHVICFGVDGHIELEIGQNGRCGTHNTSGAIIKPKSVYIGHRGSLWAMPRHYIINDWPRLSLCWFCARDNGRNAFCNLCYIGFTHPFGCHTTNQVSIVNRDLAIWSSRLPNGYSPIIETLGDFAVCGVACFRS